MNDDQARSEDVLVGFMGFRDGTVKPVKFRMNEDATIAYLAVVGGDEMVFDTCVDEYTYENSEAIVSAFITEDYENFIEQRNELIINGSGFIGLQTPLDGLPEGTVMYSGYLDMYGLNQSDGTMDLNVDFASATVGGSIDGTLYAEGGELAYTGEIDGALTGGRLAADIAVAGEGVSGGLSMLGAIYDGGYWSAGGIAGTLNGETLGGDYWVGL